MKGLKIGAIVSLSIFLVMAAMAGYLFLTAEVSVTAVSAVGYNAADDLQLFEQLKASVTDETFIGTLYQKPTEWKAASEYVILNYTIRLSNQCLVPLDMIEVQIVPQSGDILQLSDLAVHSLAMKSEGELSARILAPKDSHSVRELIVTYYVWGVGLSVRTTCGA